jgi:hypothetical protein
MHSSGFAQERSQARRRPRRSSRAVHRDESAPPACAGRRSANSAPDATAALIPPARAQREGGPGGEWRGSLRSRDLVACALAPEESLPSRPTFRPRPDLFRPAMALAAGEAPAVKDRGGRTESAPDGGRRDKGDPLERLARPALLRAGGGAPRLRQGDSRRRSPWSCLALCVGGGGSRRHKRFAPLAMDRCGNAPRPQPAIGQIPALPVMLITERMAGGV